MSIPNWNDMNLYHYLAICGGVFVLLALILFFTRLSKLKVPAIFLGIVGGFAAGVGLGVVGMGFLGYHWEPQAAGTDARETMAMNGPPPAPGGMMGGGARPGGMMGGGGGGGGRQGGGGGRGPNYKNQLATLVAKLDLLTHTPLAVRLDAKQKDEVRKQLKDLEDGELSAEEAKKRLDALKDVLKDHLKTLEDAGYRWPREGGGFPPRPADVPNPFTEEQNEKHLKALRELLAEAPTE